MPYAMATMVRPKATAMPRISIEVAPLPMLPMTAAPQPISTSANVPMNSAIAFFMFMAISPLSEAVMMPDQTSPG